MVGSRRAQAKLEFDPASSEHGTLLTRQLLEASLKRGNIPSGIGDHMFRQHRPDAKTRLWAVDCIMERQTIPHFLEFLASGRLPNGEQCALPRPTEDEIAKMTIPFSAWAPAPYNENRQPAIEAMMMRTASTEDPWRLFTISKELHAMKSRVWEGIMPLSERRWKNLKLDEPDNFHAACQFIAAVTQVFHYLNHPEVKKALRATFNLISAEFRMYGDAINAQRAISGTDGPNPRLDVSNLWYEFIKAHYDFMTTTAHHWVVEHIDRLREPIMQELEDHQPEVPGPHDERQWALTNKLHDLLENGSHADYAITLPMDGYNGGTLAVQDRVPLNARDRRGFREEPITWNAHTNRRKLDYSGRLRHLSLHEMYKDTAAQFRSGPLSPPRVVNNPLNVVCTARSQFTAQAMARQELRGEPKTPGMNLWLKKVKEECGNPEFEWGYVIYQLSYEHSDEQWAEFKTKFEADIANWDQGITDIDDVRSMCKVHWLEGKKLGIEDGDVEAAKKHFKKYVGSGSNPEQIRKEIFLVADRGVVNSYLKPATTTTGFVLAVDSKFAPTEKSAHKEMVSPGYTGTLRLPGSLLWDDIGAMLVMQTQVLIDLWPLAMTRPALMYEGPVPLPVLLFPPFESLDPSLARVVSAVSLLVVSAVLGKEALKE